MKGTSLYFDRLIISGKPALIKPCTNPLQKLNRKVLWWPQTRCNSAVNHTHGISDALSDYNSCSFKRIIPQQTHALNKPKELARYVVNGPVHHRSWDCSLFGDEKKSALDPAAEWCPRYDPANGQPRSTSPSKKRNLLEQICKSLHCTTCQLRDIWTFEQSRGMEYIQGVPQGTKTNKGQGTS